MISDELLSFNKKNLHNECISLNKTQYFTMILYHSIIQNTFCKIYFIQKHPILSDDLDVYTHNKYRKTHFQSLS